MRMDQHIKQLIEKYTLEASRLSHYDALERYNMAYTQAKELGNAFTLRACAANLGAMYISLGTKAEAEKGLKYLKEATPPEGMADGVSNGDLYFNFGLAYEVLGRYREAAGSFKQALQEYRRERDNMNMEIETLKRLQQISLVRQKHGEAVEWCQELEETYGRASKLREQQLVMIQRITLQQQLPGQQDRAQQQVVQEETQQDRMGQEETQQHRVGQEDKQQDLMGHDTSEDVERCCDLFNTVRQRGVSAGQVMAEVGLLVQMSVLLTQFKHLEKARKYLEEAESLFEAEDDQSMEQAVVLQNLGTVCNYLNDWKTALPHHIKAATIYQYYASLSPDPKSPIQPRAAQRCLGHCFANHAYALVHLDDVDEARVLFDKAREQADRSGDFDTKWQMDEALGAVHFRIACHDLNPHGLLSAETKVQLPVSHLEHLRKSMMWYKMALTDLASAPRGTEEVRDRVLEKYTQVQNFRKNASVGPVGIFSDSAHFTLTDKAAENTAEKSSASEDEEEEVDGGTSEIGEGVKDGETERKEEKQEESTSIDAEDSTGMENVMRTTAEDDDDEAQVKAHMKAQLDLDTLQRSGVQKTVQAEVYAQHKKPHSSSAESGSSDSSEEEDEDNSSEEQEEEDRRQLPPVPSQSPPRTMQASGTYERPQAAAETHINQLYGSSHSRPRSPAHGSTNYGDIDFSEKNVPRSGELAFPSKRRISLNYFISSSDEEQGEAMKQRKPTASTAGAGHNDSDFEEAEVRQGSPQRPSSHSSQQAAKQVGFQMGGDDLSHSQSKSENKDSKTCIIM